MYQIESHDTLQYVIKTASKTFGPYPSRQVAEANLVAMNLLESAQIVPTTGEGKQVLFG